MKMTCRVAPCEALGKGLVEIKVWADEAYRDGSGMIKLPCARSIGPAEAVETLKISAVAELAAEFGVLDDDGNWCTEFDPIGMGQKLVPASGTRGMSIPANAVWVGF